MAKTVIGVFDQKQDAEQAIFALQEEGFDVRDLSIVMKHSTVAQEIYEDTRLNVAEGAVSGAAVGVVIGGIAGLLTAIVIPGLGAFLVGGPIAALLGLTGVAATTLSGAATGAVAGGILGTLVSLGVPKGQAEIYEERIRSGAILLAVPVEEDLEDRVREILEGYRAADINSVVVPTDTAIYTEKGYNSPRHAAAGTKGGRVKKVKMRKSASSRISKIDR